jgi:hypothetical protein
MSEIMLNVHDAGRALHPAPFSRRRDSEGGLCLAGGVVCVCVEGAMQTIFAPP